MRRDPTRFAVVLFALGLALRLVASFALAAEPVWDGHYYDFGARRIAGGFGYGDDIVRDGVSVFHPWCHYPVGYSAYLALFYRLFGADQGVAHVANGIVGAMLGVVTYLLAREALSEKRAKLAGALVAAHPGLVLYSALSMSEPLSALLVLASFLVALKIGGARGVAFGAVVMGVAALVRPQGLLCAPFLALAVRSTTRARVGLAIAACVVAVVTVSPWTARNCRVMDGCALVSTNAGWNLAIGSFPRATGRFETLRSEDGCREVTGQVQQDRCWLAYGLDHIEAAPGRWLALVPAKLAYTFDHESFAVEYLREARPAAWPEDRRVAARGILTALHRLFVAASPLAFIALALPKKGAPKKGMVQTALLAALGLAAYAAFSANAPTFWPLMLVACALPWLPLPGRPPSHPALLMAISLVATTALAHAIFFGEDRYHVVATPVLCLLAAAALRAPDTRAARTPEGVRAAGRSSS
ncbi:MAG: glycosyltransferase family 39 protein [Labilithrix sp.]|nr:glycosyltransferase family 39 protein [Labilithrix sp.]